MFAGSQVVAMDEEEPPIEPKPAPVLAVVETLDDQASSQEERASPLTRSTLNMDCLSELMDAIDSGDLVRIQAAKKRLEDEHLPKRVEEPASWWLSLYTWLFPPPQELPMEDLDFSNLESWPGK